MSKIFSNVCPRDCCNCRIQTVVNEDRIISITGDKDDPYTLGALCAKGYAYLEQQSSQSRLLYPLKQKVKGSGEYERITWDTALTEIASKLIEIKETEESLLPVCLDKFMGNTGLLSQSVEGFFRSIGYITIMTGSPCNAAGIDALILNYGACKKPHPSDMANANLIIIWGGNPAWTGPHQMRYVFNAQAKGAKVVVIDPYLTATAARADLYIQIKPGTDGFLALGMARVLIEENLIADDFLNTYTHGWENYRKYLEGIDLVKIAKCTGVPVKEIRNLACLYGSAKPATIWLGIGAQHYPSGGQNYRAIDALAAITGNIGIPGGNVHYVSMEPTFTSGAFGNIKPPLDAKGFIDENGVTTHRKILIGRFTEFQRMQPPIRFLWIAGHNPVAQNPESTHMKEVIQSIETVVVVESVLTASALYADYVLPVTTFFEQEDVVISNWHYGIAVNEQAVSPPGECKSDLSIMRELAKTVNKLSPGFSTFPVERSDSEWLDLEMKNELYHSLGIRHYRELFGRYLTFDLPVVPWRDYSFLTPSGKYEFEAQGNAKYGNKYLPIPTELPKPTAFYPLQLISVRCFATLNSQFGYLSELLEPAANCLLINPLTAKQYRLREKDEACIYNCLGEIRLPVSLTNAVPPNLIVAYLASKLRIDSELNSLIALEEADLGELSFAAKGLTYKNCFVNMLKVQ